MCIIRLYLLGEWDNACNELQKMLLIRSLRPDRVSFCATSFITNNLGSRFVEPPVLDMQHVVQDSSTKTPLIFVLSPGVVCTLGLPPLIKFLYYTICKNLLRITSLNKLVKL